MHSWRSVLTLERLTDEDVREIVVGAIVRVSHQRVDADANVLDDGGPLSSQGSSQVLSSQESCNYSSFPHITDRVLSSIVSLSSGDARTALSLLELVLCTSDMKEDDLITSLRRSISTSYDRTGDSRYDMISALHKSVRGSQGSAAIYWLARMLTGGEDPVYIARRMVVCASEDIGLADNQALTLVSPTGAMKITILTSLSRQLRLFMHASRSVCQSAGLTWHISLHISLRLRRAHVPMRHINVQRKLRN